jgi:voltage-gated sodium channel
MSWRQRFVAEPVGVAAIFLAAIAMVAIGFTEAGSTARSVWVVIDLACVGYFVVEVILKVSLAGWRGYWALRWNRFDFVVTVLSLPVLVAPFTSDAGLFAGVPIVRLFRLFRLFRLMRFIPHHERLGMGIMRALRASVGVFIGIGIVNFIFAMLAHLLFADVAPEYFGDPARACYSMFRIFTVEGWNDIPDAITASASASWTVVARLYFGFAVLIGGILALSLGNAVFVDEMMADNNDTMEREIGELTAEISVLRGELRGVRELLGVLTSQRKQADPEP